MVRGEARRIESICRGITKGLKGRLQIRILEKEIILRRQKHADALIISNKGVIILEVTGRVSVGEELEKLRNVYQSLGQMIRGAGSLKVFPVIHLKKISAIDRRRLSNEKVGPFPVFTMSCDKRLMDIMPL